jgi:hypothetical protein
MRTGPRSFLTLAWLPPWTFCLPPYGEPRGVDDPREAPCRCEWCSASWGPLHCVVKMQRATARMVGFPVLDQDVWRARVPGFLA